MVYLAFAKKIEIEDLQILKSLEWNSSTSQYVQGTLNKIEGTFNRTFAGAQNTPYLKSFIKGHSIHI